MRTPEILAKVTPSTPSQEIGFKVSGQYPDVVWQDILLAMQGIPQGRFAFMMYVYGDDDHAKHSFFAELFMDVMSDIAIQQWILRRKDQGNYHREVEAMCQLAVSEWKAGGVPPAQVRRAEFMGVSRGTWRRRYFDVYKMILSRPVEWEKEIMKLVTDRLR